MIDKLKILILIPTFICALPFIALSMLFYMQSPPKDCITESDLYKWRKANGYKI